MANKEYSQTWLTILAAAGIFGNGLLIALVGVPNLGQFSAATIGAFVLNLVLLGAGLAVFPREEVFDFDNWKDQDFLGSLAIALSLVLVGLTGVLAVFNMAAWITNTIPVWVGSLLALAGFVLVNLFWVEEGVARVRGLA